MANPNRPPSPRIKKRVSFKNVAVALGSCAIFVAVLNLYMNMMATYSIPSLQLDLSADGDVIGFHQFDLVSAAAEETVYQKRTGNKLSEFALRAGINPKHLVNFKNVHSNPDVDEGDPSKKKSGENKKQCTGLCAPPGSLQTQPNYVKSLIEARIKHVPKNSFLVPMGTPTKTLNKPPTLLDFQKVWKTVADWVSDRAITPIDKHGVLSVDKITEVVEAVSSAKVLRTGVPKKGTQLKVSMLLQGRQNAIWKPQRYSRNGSIPNDTPYSGFDRHNGEIAAFHIANMIGLNRVPIAIGRSLNLKEEVYELADEVLEQTFFNDSSGKLCLYGKCLYCKREDSVCVNPNQGKMEGTVILWLPIPYSTLSRIRSPWARTYDPSRSAQWQTNINYCDIVMQHEFFGNAPVFLDLIDMAVLDWLIGNADRHRLEYSEGPLIHHHMILLLDNGKSFGNADMDEITILAPVYQCCRLRKRLYDQLIRYSEENFGSTINERLRLDPTYPVLSGVHLEALNRRLRKILVVIAACIEQHGETYVLKDDGF